jgi:1-deoxy-D-xylulose-5-phosphate synthase
MAANNYKSSVVRLGIPDKFIEQGTVEELHRECGYDAQGIYNTISGILLPEKMSLQVQSSTRN